MFVFSPNYGKIAWPLTEQLKKNNLGEMIRHKSIASVLNMPDFGKEFLVGCDALGGGVGAVLFKKADLSCIIARRWLIEHQPSPLMRGNSHWCWQSNIGDITFWDENFWSSPTTNL